MNMKTLYDNIEEIEKSVEQYEKGKLSYDECLDNLLSFGYSFKEAAIILRNSKGY
jgi:hypothetical protein